VSGALAIALATAAPQPLDNAISISIPSLDGARGAQVSYERWLFADYGVSVAGDVQLHESAIGDYTGIRTGAGGEVRWYWRASSRWGPQPDGSMIGWFTGARIDVAADWTHDHADQRWLGTAMSVGVAGEIGYRLAPWRQLVITGLTGISVRTDFDLSGRVPDWTRAAYDVGLELGWLF